MDCSPLLCEAAAQQAVDFDAAVEFLTEVLPAGVGDGQAQRQLQHGGRAGAVERAYGRGGVPRGAMRSEVPEQAGVQQFRRLGAVADLADLPGVHGQCGVPVGQRQPGAGEPGGELLGRHGAAAIGPGRVSGEYGGGDGHPVQRKGAARLG